jgi:hypothetical protein
MFQMQSTQTPGRPQQQGSSLQSQMTHSLGGYSNINYDIQPNKVIIEQTEESSMSS